MTVHFANELAIQHFELEGFQTLPRQKNIVDTPIKGARRPTIPPHIAKVLQDKTVRLTVVLFVVGEQIAGLHRREVEIEISTQDCRLFSAAATPIDDIVDEKTPSPYVEGVGMAVDQCNDTLRGNVHCYSQRITAHRSRHLGLFLKGNLRKKRHKAVRSKTAHE